MKDIMFLPDKKRRTTVMRNHQRQIDKNVMSLTYNKQLHLCNISHETLITKCLARRLTSIIAKLYPNKTAYLLDKQIQDNLRTINIVNRNVPNLLLVELDERKAF